MRPTVHLAAPHPRRDVLEEVEVDGVVVTLSEAVLKLDDLEIELEDAQE